MKAVMHIAHPNQNCLLGPSIWNHFIKSAGIPHEHKISGRSQSLYPPKITRLQILLLLDSMRRVCVCVCVVVCHT